MNLKPLFIMLISFTLLAACAPQPVQTPTVPPTSAPYVAPIITPYVAPTHAPYVAPYIAPAVVPTDTPSGAPTSAPISTYPVPTTNPPSLIPTQVGGDQSHAERAAIEAVSKKYNIPVDKIQVVSTEAVTWPNGCLGVVIPGVMCTQNLVDGFLVRLLANGRQFEIHTDQSGTSVIDAAQQLATLRFVVSTADHTIQVVDSNIGLGPTYNPAFNGLLPSGGTIAGTAYVLDLINNKAVAVEVVR